MTSRAPCRARRAVLWVSWGTYTRARAMETAPLAGEPGRLRGLTSIGTKVPLRELR